MPYGARKSRQARPPRKAASQMQFCPYRTPTPVGEGKYPQVDERTSVKELGKLTPYLWKKGSPSSFLLGDQQGVRGTQKEAQATVYQKHRSLRRRKPKYRG